MDDGQPVVTVVKEKGVSPEKVVRLFLLGQGPVLRVEFFVFRKMECVKQINHLLCGWLKMLKLTVKNLL